MIVLIGISDDLNSLCRNLVHHILSGSTLMLLKVICKMWMRRGMSWRSSWVLVGVK